MDKDIKSLIGSRSRDIFRYAHKHLLPKSNYGGDIDFFLLSNNGILAFIDYKTEGDKTTWTEEIAYKELIGKGYLIFLVQGKMTMPPPGFNPKKLNDFPKYEAEIREDYKTMEIFRYIIKDGKLVIAKAHISKDYFLFEEYLRKNENEIMRLKN